MTVPSVEGQLHAYIAYHQLVLPSVFVAKVAQYVSFLQKWGAVYNLLASCETSIVLDKHIFDSLNVIPVMDQYYPRTTDQSVIDVGTGAGLPGLVLALAYPQWQWTLLDARSKKVEFLRYVVAMCAIKNVNVVQSRVEEWHNKRFTCIVSRAFASLDRLIVLTQHLKTAEGRWLVWVSQRPSDRMCTQITEQLSVAVQAVVSLQQPWRRSVASRSPDDHPAVNRHVVVVGP